MDSFAWIWVIIWIGVSIFGAKKNADKQRKDQKNYQESIALVKQAIKNVKESKSDDDFGKSIADKLFSAENKEILPKKTPKKKKQVIPEGVSLEGPTPMVSAMDPARVATINKVKEEAKQEALSQAEEYCDTHHGIDTVGQDNLALGMAWSIILDKPRGLKPYGGKN